MLSDRLRELEAEGIVERTVVPDTPVRVEYSLTKKGRALAPAVAAISEWANRWSGAESGTASARRTSRSRPARRPVAR
jgi:DNA-binding HxlR family transcriptional regulator